MHQENKHSFEQFIIKCCKSKEWDLRKFLKKKLIAAGFSIKEDDYRTSRCGKNNKYNRVHNMLAVRGEPRTCLVAHTDVCRDHSFSGKGVAPDVYPVIKSWGDKEKRLVIQDKDCRYQVGGDDRVGVAINTWIALNTGYDLALLFTTDEEIGLVSAGECIFPELKEFDLLVQVDRGNHSQQLVSRIGGTALCSQETVERLLKIAEEMGVPRNEVSGLATDVLMLIRNEVGKEAVNMTCGYHNSFGDSAKEYIDIEEARSTMSYVGNIVKYYDLDLDKNEEREELKLDDEEEIIQGEFDIDGLEYFFRENCMQLEHKNKEKNYKKIHKKRKYLFDGDMN